MQLLIITAHFPSYDFPGETYVTPFLYQYAEQWVKMGHDVYIIHFARNYPIIFRWVANLLVLIGDKRLIKYDYSPRAMQDSKYVYSGIKINRYKYVKYIPHGKTNRSTVKKLVKRVRKQLLSEKINPDYIIGDCMDPVVDVVGDISKQYDCPKYQIIHSTDLPWFSNEKTKGKIEKYDMLLLRSQRQKKEIEKHLGVFKYTYMYSGITEEQVDPLPKYRQEIKNLIYVGALYKTKGLETILQAISRTDNSGLVLRIIGDGVDRPYFEEKAKELDIWNRVEFVGKLSHEKVFPYMREADALVLISHETFGMVYVEAMSQGCIPIGTIDEGIDGIVKDGINGFLSPLDDIEALTRLFNNMVNYSPKEIEQISYRAYCTAKEMTNENLAASLLVNIGLSSKF